jgi:ABC-type lipoprotein release transport system permease subunit
MKTDLQTLHEAESKLKTGDPSAMEEVGLRQTISRLRKELQITPPEQLKAKLPTAQIAHEQSTKNAAKKLEHVKSVLETQIHNASQNGEFELEVKAIAPDLINELRQLGYTVTELTEPMHGNTTRITW